MITITEEGLNAFFDAPVVNWAPIIVFIVSFCLMCRQPVVVKVISPLMLAIVTFVTVQSAGLGWALRDGLGPDSIETHGEEAVAIFMEGIWTDVLFFGGLFVIALLPYFISINLQWLRRRKAEISRREIVRKRLSAIKHTE